MASSSSYLHHESFAAGSMSSSVKERVGDNSTLTSLKNYDPIKDELDNYLSQLKYKKTFQDDDGCSGKCAQALSNLMISKVMANLFGRNKNKLKREIKEMITYFKRFFLEYTNACKVTGGSKVKEIILELFHKLDFIVFQQTLANDPVNWCKGVFPVLQENTKKEALIEELEEDIKNVRSRRRTLHRDMSLMKQKRDEVVARRVKMLKKMELDNLQLLKLTYEECKLEVEKFEKNRPTTQGKSFVSNDEIRRLLSRYNELKVRHETSKQELGEVSANDALPPDANKAAGIVMNKKIYLESLIEQISDPANINRKSRSFNDSVFLN